MSRRGEEVILSHFRMIGKAKKKYVTNVLYTNKLVEEVFFFSLILGHNATDL